MPKVYQTGQFFAVGGAVQPDRPCYIDRAADAALLRGILDRQFCYVLTPKASGKSSLMARAVRDLRAEGQLVAVVDLAQIGMGGEGAGGAEAGRWSYSIAYRVLRELRLKVDLQSWWQAKGALPGGQRLAEFLWEVVLPNTTEPVTVFLDEIERAVGLPFAKELFGGIRSCYSGRTTEPELARLNFVVLGAAAPRQLCPDATISPFVEGLRIELPDFSMEETYGLAPGFGQDTRHGRGALRAIFPWTSGQPYLTQKIARGLARRGGMPSKLKEVLKDQFLGPGVRSNEALLGHISAFLTARARERRQTLALLGRVAKGEMLFYDPGSLANQLLLLSGVVGVRADGQLAFRNKLFERVFGRAWVASEMPFNWRRWSVAATLVAALIGGSIWYVRYVPRPHIDILTSATADIDAEMRAHDRLGRLPGFAGVADRLLASVMERRSRAAETFEEVTGLDAVLRGLEGYEGLADQLMDEYWIRRVEDAVRRERRDEALLLSARAVGGDERARRLTAELVGDDYRFLVRSFRLAEAPARWEVDWRSGELALVDLDHQVRRLPLNSFGEMDFGNRLTSLQHLPVSREITVNEPGSAGAFQLRLTLEHPAPEELLATLRAPSGAQASFAPVIDSSGAFATAAVAGSPLARLADENRRGVWRLTLVDRGVGSAGQLIRWGLHFAEEVRGWEDQPQGLAISDPLRTDQVDVDLSVDGRLAIAYPSRQSVVGAVSLWDLRTNSLVGDVRLEAEPDYVALTGDMSRILVVAGDNLELWDAGTGDLVSRVGTQTGFLLPPALTDSGGHVAIAERLDDQGSLYSLFRTADGELLSSVAGLAGVTGWMLGPDASYLVLVGPSRLVRIMDPRSGEVLRELPHRRDPVRLVAAATGDLLLTIDDIGDLFAWHLNGAVSSGPVRGVRLGRTGVPESVSIAADASKVAYQALAGQVVVRGLTGRSAPMSFSVSQEGVPNRTRLAPDGGRLLTYNGQQFQLWRLADSEPAGGGDAELTALGLDPVESVAVLGFQDGHIGIVRAGQANIPVSADAGDNFIGHQGSITRIAVNAAVGVIASGGSDGLVRAWELDSGAPTAPFMRHPQGPIHVVTISDDGRWLASGAELTARVWHAADGELVREVPVSGGVVSIAVDDRSGLLGVGDRDGHVFLTGVESVEAPGSVRLGAAATALAFGVDGSRMATGDAAGNVQLWEVESLAPVGGPHNFIHPVRWLGFSGDGQFLLVQTDHWMHRFSAGGDGLALMGSRLLDAGMEAGAALLVPDGSRIRMIGGREVGEPRFRELDMVRLDTGPLPPDSVLLSRDWSRILGLSVGEGGEIVPDAR